MRRSYVAPIEPEIARLIEVTRPLRERAVFWAELREWSELPWYKRVLKKRPTV